MGREEKIKERVSTALNGRKTCVGGLSEIKEKKKDIGERSSSASEIEFGTKNRRNT